VAIEIYVQLTADASGRNRKREIKMKLLGAIVDDKNEYKYNKYAEEYELVKEVLIHDGCPRFTTKEEAMIYLAHMGRKEYVIVYNEYNYDYYFAVVGKDKKFAKVIYDCWGWRDGGIESTDISPKDENIEINSFAVKMTEKEFEKTYREYRKLLKSEPSLEELGEAIHIVSNRAKFCAREKQALYDAGVRGEPVWDMKGEQLDLYQLKDLAMQKAYEDGYALPTGYHVQKVEGRDAKILYQYDIGGYKIHSRMPLGGHDPGEYLGTLEGLTPLSNREYSVTLEEARNLLYTYTVDVFPEL
jgi:hypothetical protein